ncbi:hypothetical protein quinque_004709 [Culex quinquefasciatus]|uniref:cuticle protein 16.5-like n=1 Tax=Culex quinquefasciatus TaxID=7176 RepID=UPI0018E353C8|nr:cuticle protein 16.5-like [Culex quinquefasciatus]
MFAKLFIAALAIAAVAARPGVSSVVSYSSPAVVSAVAPTVYSSSTYHGVAAPAVAYSSYAPAAVSTYSAPAAYRTYTAPVATYGAYPSYATTYGAAPVVYSAYSPYATVY